VEEEEEEEEEEEKEEDVRGTGLQSSTHRNVSASTFSIDPL
jgi:hypothetical protein